MHHRQPEREKCRKRGACIDPHGFDAGKLIKGKKRHVLVDMQGLLLHAIVHSAGIQDRDGGLSLLATLFGQFPFLAKLFADSAYEGPIFHRGLLQILPYLKTEIVKRSDQIKGFVVLRKRWIVERTIALTLSQSKGAQSLSQTCQGLGESQLQRPCLPQTRFHPPHVTKALQSLLKFRDGL